MSAASDQATNKALEPVVDENNESWVRSVEDLPAVSARGTATQNNGSNTRAE
jgi:hypothetical protein